jgi:hypothetical protein
LLEVPHSQFSHSAILFPDREKIKNKKEEKEMKKIFSLVFVLMMLLILVACECRHKDKNDDGLCDKCDVGFTDGRDMADHVHTLGDAWVVDIEATCVKEGARHKVCVTCGESTEAERVEKRALHRYKNGVCVDCGAKTALAAEAMYLRCDVAEKADPEDQQRTSHRRRRRRSKLPTQQENKE